MRHLLFTLLALVAIALAGCQPAPAAESPGDAAPRLLTLLTHDSFAVSEGVIAQFEAEHNATVNIITGGDAGTLTTQLALSAGAPPLADVVFGVDNTFLSRLLDAGVLLPYQSPLLAQIPAEFILDGDHRVTPIDYGDVCINYDVAYFTANALPVPTDLNALTDPAYADLLVVQNPASSSPGLAFLMATIATYGEDGYLDYWAALRNNGVLVVEDWTTAYYSEFSGGSGAGTRPLVVSYASSPPAEVFFAETPPTTAPTAALTAPLSCFRQIEFAGILQGTANPELAQALIDFMLSPTFQEDIPLQMFVFPVNPQAELPPVFVSYASIPAEPAVLNPIVIAENRDTWIRDWTEVVLR